MFSGIECARTAWHVIEAAVEARWGVKAGLQFQFAAPQLDR